VAFLIVAAKGFTVTKMTRWQVFFYKMASSIYILLTMVNCGTWWNNTQNTTSTTLYPTQLYTRFMYVITTF